MIRNYSKQIRLWYVQLEQHCLKEMSIKTDITHLPGWMKVPLPHGTDYSMVKNVIIQHGLNTICSSGNCPNKGECWSAGTATFMILGDHCTRNCRFCYVKALMPEPPDPDEPEKVARSIQLLDLKHCVITSVARDDLEDGGANHWVQTILKIRELNPGITMETLIPDFNNNRALLDILIQEKPEVISHNIETVERISPKIRSLATYEKSLQVLSYLSQSEVITKSGFMLGLGETENEVLQTMDDLLNNGVHVLTIGQYLPPSEVHAKLVEYVKPEVFKKFKSIGLEKGFRYVESGPLVRSSYHAERHIHVKP